MFGLIIFRDDDLLGRYRQNLSDDVIELGFRNLFRPRLDRFRQFVNNRSQYSAAAHAAFSFKSRARIVSHWHLPGAMLCRMTPTGTPPHSRCNSAALAVMKASHSARTC